MLPDVASSANLARERLRSLIPINVLLAAFSPPLQVFKAKSRAVVCWILSDAKQKARLKAGRFVGAEISDLFIWGAVLIDSSNLLNTLAKMLSEQSHSNTQQDQSDKAPKYPPPRLMTAAIDRRFFGLPVHQATANAGATKLRILQIL